MQSRWTDSEAPARGDLLATRVHTSRLLGADPQLVMHGGGNTSVKVTEADAVFDTGIWDEATLESRAASYGLSVEEYRKNNLLGVEVTSADVAGVMLALCTPTFAKTTAAQIPIDGGNERIV